MKVIVIVGLGVAAFFVLRPMLAGGGAIVPEGPDAGTRDLGFGAADEPNAARGSSSRGSATSTFLGRLLGTTPGAPK